MCTMYIIKDYVRSLVEFEFELLVAKMFCQSMEDFHLTTHHNHGQTVCGVHCGRGPPSIHIYIYIYMYAWYRVQSSLLLDFMVHTELAANHDQHNHDNCGGRN